jgi:putative endonuclease
MFLTSNPYHVYMVRCNDGTLYTGITTNLERRLQQHNGERFGGAKYTRAKRPVELVYVEKYDTRSEASRREYQIKNEFTHLQKEELMNPARKI